MKHLFGSSPMSRRKALSTLGSGACLGVAGCLDGETDSIPEPIDLSGQKTDYQGGMVIGDHGGPNGQVFYADTDPQPRQGAGAEGAAPENVAWFHTLVHGLFPYHFGMRDEGAEALAVYVTDYSNVDWELSEGSMTMPAPTNAASFADATDLTYVAESDARGGMGPTLVPFSDSKAADGFANEYNGRTVSYDAIDRQLINGLQQTNMG